MSISTTLTSKLDSANRADDVFVAFDLVDEQLVFGLAVQVALFAVFVVRGCGFVSFHCGGALEKEFAVAEGAGDSAGWFVGGQFGEGGGSEG